MKILIVKQPRGTVAGVSLDDYHPGRVYEVATEVANYLVVEGFAVVEMRSDNTSRPPTDRRKKP